MQVEIPVPFNYCCGKKPNMIIENNLYCVRCSKCDNQTMWSVSRRRVIMEWFGVVNPLYDWAKINFSDITDESITCLTCKGVFNASEKRCIHCQGLNKNY